jgi:signal transduction histidine kinase
MFTGILGHDLRNPLQAIVTSAHLLIGADNDTLVRPAARVLASGQRMGRMIDQLLDFTRVRVGNGVPLAPLRVDLVTLVRDVVGEIEDARGCVIRLTQKGRADGRWDPDRLSQVFSNLVANAVQHGDPAAGVDVGIDGEGDPVVVVVENGGGIPPDLRARLFEPMAGGVRRRDGSQGLGLGLFITREIVAAHGGRIDVDCGDDRTAFVVSLPRGA